MVSLSEHAYQVSILNKMNYLAHTLMWLHVPRREGQNFNPQIAVCDYVPQSMAGFTMVDIGQLFYLCEVSGLYVRVDHLLRLVSSLGNHPFFNLASYSWDID